MSKGYTMGKRLTKWFWFNLVFALLPLLFLILIRKFGEQLTLLDIANSSEILFFCTMMSITSAADAFEFRQQHKQEILLTNIFMALISIALVSSGLYACLLRDTILNTGQSAFRSNLFYFSILLSLGSLAVSFMAQWFIGKAEGTT
jgi:glucan phosphoethanolaminetransferase (alkaline phosphatase superfamily)